MQKTKGEIVARFRNAKNKRQQVRILADLNACDKGMIEDILLEWDLRPLYDELDKLESSIKALEADYGRVYEEIMTALPERIYSEDSK